MTTSRIKKDEPAVEVKQNARPARHEDPTVPSTPANGRESKRPIDDQLPRVPFWFEVVLPVPAYIHSPTVRSGFVIPRDLLPRTHQDKGISIIV